MSTIFMQIYKNWINVEIHTHSDCWFLVLLFLYWLDWFFRFTSMAPHQQQSIFIVQLLISPSDHPRPNPGLSTHKRTTTIALDGRAAQEEDLVDVKRDQ